MKSKFQRLYSSRFQNICLGYRVPRMQFSYFIHEQVGQFSRFFRVTVRICDSMSCQGTNWIQILLQLFNLVKAMNNDNSIIIIFQTIHVTINSKVSSKYIRIYQYMCMSNNIYPVKVSTLPHIINFYHSQTNVFPYIYSSSTYSKHIDEKWSKYIVHAVKIQFWSTTYIQKLANNITISSPQYSW